MPPTILTLPIELQSHILTFLPWHDHFLASSVHPLWLSILRTESFRRRRHYGRSPPDTFTSTAYRARDALNPGMTYHGDVPRRCIDDDRGERELNSHGLVELGVFRLGFERGEGNPAASVSEVSMVVVEKVDGWLYKYDRKAFDIAGCGLLDSDFVFFGLKDKQPQGGLNGEEEDGIPYWTVEFMVSPWTPNSAYEPGVFTNSQDSLVITPDVRIPVLKLRRDIWESKEGTLRNFIGALKGHVGMVFFRNPGVRKCRLDVVNLRSGFEDPGKVAFFGGKVEYSDKQLR
ncbi:uncharacterized protein DFL_006566 [Arthrobotrys flagrans]|uniref:F-box domain-containing protein n=1 Tax=Arthrobotrys flagrans TaxID=97331 RepID=A0A436ZTG3_ARTFL|nr:hypothetical protein DFL_006566 [Arthrobotrys flagrans]